jgi:glycosyltransferase involved in cell wall biosynthesis
MHDRGPAGSKEKELTVVICTRNRAESLRLTLKCLTQSYRTELPVEILVVDNGSVDATREVVDSFRTQFPLRYVFEPLPGKGHCLNRALACGNLGRIFASLDDDMSPDFGWFDAVLESCVRLPEVGIFGGHVYIIWPETPAPEWTKSCRSDVRGWVFSAMSNDPRPDLTTDQPLRRDRWPSGNHFWFRSSLLDSSSRFGENWISGPSLLLGWADRGAKSVICHRASAGHRIQPGLWQGAEARKRARAVGAALASIALQPYRPSLKYPRAFRRFPLAMRSYSVAMLIRFRTLYLLSRCLQSPLVRIDQELHALERVAFFAEVLRIARTDPTYRVAFGRRIPDMR